jgi:catechol 2,3-dioxygenase-like lactoylglutathione lyase family enzyme
VDIGEILGLHHVKLAVSDLARSRTWYERVFELQPKVEFADDDGAVRGVSYQPKGGFALALREIPALALAMTGFDPLAILVESRDGLEAWGRRLDELGVAHTPVTVAALGWMLSFDDPDGLLLKLYTREEHGLERRNRHRVRSAEDTSYGVSG